MSEPLTEAQRTAIKYIRAGGSVVFNVKLTATLKGWEYGPAGHITRPAPFYVWNSTLVHECLEVVPADFVIVASSESA